MGDTLSNGGRPSGMRLTLPEAAPARSRVAAQPTQDRRRALLVGGGMLLMAALGAAAIIQAETRMSGPSPQLANATPGLDVRTAKITAVSGDGCSQQVFDNQTGRMSPSVQPCETTAYDSNGVPLPTGTMHRLDAISKSFSGR